MALPFHRKVSVLLNNFSNSWAANSIIHDLIQEFDYLEKLYLRGKSVDLAISFDKFNYLAHRVKDEEAFAERFSEAERAVICRILAALLVYADYQYKFLSNRPVVNYVKEKIFELPFSRDERLFMNSEGQRLLAAAKVRAKQLPGIEKSTNLKNMLIYPAIHRVQSTQSLLDENLIINQQSAGKIR